VRNFKVKQKISGQFKTGQAAYYILRYVIDTSLKKCSGNAVNDVHNSNTCISDWIVTNIIANLIVPINIS